MPDFILHGQVTRPYPSVTAQLKAWHVPKQTRFLLRQTKGVLVNGTYRHAHLPVAPGDALRLLVADATPPVYARDTGLLAVVYEDAHLLVVNKPTGMKPHPNQPGERGTLMNRVAAYLAPQPAYITHRLDMLTSGLTVIAKDPLSQAIINQAIGAKTMHRTYTALVKDGLPEAGTITAPIGQDPEDKRKRMVRADGLPAITHYQVTARRHGIARVRLQLETGRTHQLRVHLAYLGYPILGDPLYSQTWAPRLMLHATELTLVHPLSETSMTVTSPVPF